MGNINESVRDNNIRQYEYRKIWDMRKFFKTDLWKYTGCILSEVTYGKKGCRLLGKSNISEKGNKTWLIGRYACGNTYVQKVSFLICLFNHR